MSLVFLAIIFIYTGFIVFAVITWEKIISQPLPRSEKDSGFISIIIPVRNEATQIERLLSAIAKQSFPISYFEVIIVDDHSEDETLEIVNAQVFPFKIRTISLKELTEIKGSKIFGKKQAITEGVLQANGEIIVTTDADCFMGKKWLLSISNYFESFDAQMVVGAVTFYKEQNLFQRIQTVEFAALVGTGAVSLKLGQPNMCNGANLAFTRKAFDMVGGYEGNDHIPSGDDEFLLQKIYKLYPKAVYFNSCKEGIVYTFPAKQLITFINQRRRWSGKWKLHKSLTLKMLALSIFMFHLMFISFAIGAIFWAFNPFVFMLGFIVKATAEFVFLKKILNNFEKRLHLNQFMFLQSFYSVYVVIFGVMANFGTFDWKGRKYKQ